MYKTLSPGTIGIRGLSLQENIQLASQTGFEGLDFSIQDAAKIANDSGVDAVKALFTDNGIRPGCLGSVGGLAWRWLAGGCGESATICRAGGGTGCDALRDLVPAFIDRARVC